MTLANQQVSWLVPVLGLSLVAAALAYVLGIFGARLLGATLASIAGQVEVPVECLVVEQDTTPAVAAALPGWVRHVHAPPPDPAMPYSRSWATWKASVVRSAQSSPIAPAGTSKRTS